MNTLVTIKDFRTNGGKLSIGRPIYTKQRGLIGYAAKKQHELVGLTYIRTASGIGTHNDAYVYVEVECTPIYK